MRLLRVVGRQQARGGQHVVTVHDDLGVARQLPATCQVLPGGGQQHASYGVGSAVPQDAPGADQQGFLTSFGRDVLPLLRQL